MVSECIIDVVNFIGTRGLDYRGSQFGAAYIHVAQNLIFVSRNTTKHRSLLALLLFFCLFFLTVLSLSGATPAAYG